jgi:uncharacterized protein
MMIPESQKPFTLLIKPASADCNLRCEYCFYLGHQSFYPSQKSHRMPPEVLEQMISSFMSTAQPQYTFAWQGGEPVLMGYDFYRNAIELQKKYGKPGTIVCNSIQTNGTLVDRRLAQLFAEYNFLAGVSLDGPADIHDLYRKTVAGEGSHERVMAGIETLRQAGVEFNILCLVSQANVKKAKDIFRFYVENGFHFLQFIPCVEFDRQNLLYPFALTAEQWGDFLCELFDEWIRHGPEKVYIRGFEAILAKLVNNSTLQCNMGNNCCAYFVMEWNGDVFPCDFFVKKELLLGNIMVDSWDTINRSLIYRDFGKQKSQRNSACRICPYLRLCAGDCLKHRIYGTRTARKASVTSARVENVLQNIPCPVSKNTPSTIC